MIQQSNTCLYCYRLAVNYFSVVLAVMFLQGIFCIYGFQQNDPNDKCAGTYAEHTGHADSCVDTSLVSRPKCSPTCLLQQNNWRVFSFAKTGQVRNIVSVCVLINPKRMIDKRARPVVREAPIMCTRHRRPEGN